MSWSRAADLGQDSEGLGFGGRRDQASDDHLLKRPIITDRLTQPQTGVDNFDSLDQPARPASGDLRPSHRTTAHGRLTATVEYRPQVQNLLTHQKPLMSQAHQRSQLSLVMS